MSKRSYLDTVRPQIDERDQKVKDTVNMLLRLVRTRAIFDADSRGRPMALPGVRPDPEHPQEVVWVSLSDESGERISQEDTVGQSDIERLVGSGALMLAHDDGFGDRHIATIEVEPPNVRGYDGTPLNAAQIDGVIGDLERYEAALATH